MLTDETAVGMIRRMTEPTEPEHVGVTEIGEILGVTRQRAYTLTKRADFPAPVATTRAGRAWDKASVVEWSATWDRTNKGGRPRKTP